MSRSQILAEHRAPGLRFREELRPPSFEGPQRACHPDEIELCVLVDGAEHVQQGRAHALARGGQYSLVAAGREHSSWTTDARVHERILHIGRERLAALADDAGLAAPVDLPLTAFEAPAELTDAVGMLARELAAGPASAGRGLLVDALAVAIWVPLLRRHGAPPRIRSDGAAPDRRLRRVEECLRADLAGEHTLDALAEVAGLSRYHLLRRFKHHYGLPPYAYLTRLRVERAAALALETELPLTRIAMDVGFGSSSRLTEAFKRHYGQVPNRWRRERKASAIFGKVG